MKRGFTILELLVASLLLGMLMTILTMIFSQSSIAWRTGMAGIADLSRVREDISGIRYKADNAYPDQDGQLRCVESIFDKTGAIRTDRDSYLGDFSGTGVSKVKNSIPVSNPQAKDSYQTDINCGNSAATEGAENYVINVMSAGPDRTMDTFDDIWSFPDDPEEWCK